MLNQLCQEALRMAREHGFTDATPSEDIALMLQEIKSANAEANKRTRQGEEAYRAAREKYGDAIIESVLKS